MLFSVSIIILSFFFSLREHCFFIFNYIYFPTVLSQHQRPCCNLGLVTKLLRVESRCISYNEFIFSDAACRFHCIYAVACQCIWLFTAGWIGKYNISSSLLFCFVVFFIWFVKPLMVFDRGFMFDSNRRTSGSRHKVKICSSTAEPGHEFF